MHSWERDHTEISLLDCVTDAIVVIDASMQFSFANRAALGSFGLPVPDADSGERADAPQGMDAQSFVYEDDLDRVMTDLALILIAPGASIAIEFRVHHRDGLKHVQATATNHLETPGIEGIVVCFRDLDREVSLSRVAKHLREATERTSDLILVHGMDGSMLFSNDAARQQLGFDERLERADFSVYPDNVRMQIEEEITPALLRDGSWSGTIAFEQPESPTRWYALVAKGVDLRDPIEGTMSFTWNDITDRVELERTLIFHATHDPLTGIANRIGFTEELDSMLQRKPSGSVALLFVDLDHFKHVNDSYGHGVGDQLLGEITERVSSVLREGDFFARLGGDEFVVVIEGRAHDDRATTLRLAQEVAERIHRVVSRPVYLAETPLYVGASIGIAVNDSLPRRTAPGGKIEKPSAALLKNADIAMYRAKALGRARTEVFSSELAEVVEQRGRVRSELHTAVKRNQLVVVYQPIADAGSGQLLGFEALVRWNHSKGLLPPAAFLEIAEETDLICEIDSFVLQRACDDLADLMRRAMNDDLFVAVNVSSRQLEHPDFESKIRSAVASSGIQAEQLHVELTETAVMANRGRAMANIARLRQLGLSVSIDDFGTGYSSLSQLNAVRPDVVKIDRSFVESLSLDAYAPQIIQAVTHIGQNFGLITVAEGVETLQQLEAVRALGCDRIQGYLLSPPVMISDVLRMARQGSFDLPAPIR
jgi:diguanylate cyclase (GGDEF)-like protein